MSWRDRDWAKFTDEERRALWGTSSSSSLRTVVGVVVGAAAIIAFVFAYSHRRDSSPVRHAPSIVYAGATAYDRNSGDRLACTAQGMSTQSGAWVCTQWTILAQDQVVRPAVEDGTPCGLRHVNQPDGRWACDAAPPPDPGLLPNGAALSPSV